MRLLAVAAAAVAAGLAQAQSPSSFRADSLIAYTISNMSRVTERITLEEWSEMPPMPGTMPKLSTTVLSADPSNPTGNMTWITADGVTAVTVSYQQVSSSVQGCFIHCRSRCNAIPAHLLCPLPYPLRAFCALSRSPVFSLQSLLSLAADGSRLTIAGYPVAEGALTSPAFAQLNAPPVRRVVAVLPDRSSAVLGHVACGSNAALSTYSVDRTGVWVACRGPSGLSYLPAGGAPVRVHANFSAMSQLAFVPAPAFSSSAPTYGDMYMVGASADASSSGSGSSSGGNGGAREVGVFLLGSAASAPLGVQGAAGMPPAGRTLINNTAVPFMIQPGYAVPSTPVGFVAHLAMLPSASGIPIIYTRFWVCDSKPVASGGGVYVYEPVDPMMAPNGLYRLVKRVAFPSKTSYGCAAIAGRYVGTDLILHVLAAQSSVAEQSLVLAFNTSSGMVRTAMRSTPGTLIRSFAYAPCDPVTGMCPVKAPDGLFALPPLTPAAADALATAADWSPADIADPLVPTPSVTPAPIRASASPSPSVSSSVSPSPSGSAKSNGGGFLASPSMSGKPAADTASPSVSALPPRESASPAPAQGSASASPASPISQGSASPSPASPFGQASGSPSPTPSASQSSTTRSNVMSPSQSGKPAVESPFASASQSGKAPLQESATQTPKAPLQESASASAQPNRASQSPSGVPARSSEPVASPSAQAQQESASQTPKVNQESASATPKVQQESASQTPKVQQESASATPKQQQASATMTQRVVNQESASQTPKVPLPSASQTPKAISASASATRSPFTPRPTPSGTPTRSRLVDVPSVKPSVYPSRSPLAIDATVSRVNTSINMAWNYAAPSPAATPAASRAPGASPAPSKAPVPASPGAAMANAAAMCAIREKLASIAGLPLSNVTISALVEWRKDAATNSSAAYLLRFWPAADDAGCKPLAASPSPAAQRAPGLRALQAAADASTVTEEPITREAAAAYGAVPPTDPSNADSEGAGLSIPFELALDAPAGSDATSTTALADQLNAAQSRVQSAFASVGSGNEADAILGAVSAAAGAPVAAGSVPSGQVAAAPAQAPPSAPTASSSSGSAAGAIIGSLVALAVVAGALVVVRRARRAGGFANLTASGKSKAHMSKSPVVTMTVQAAHPGSGAAAGSGAGTGMRAASARSAAAVATSADVISFANPVANMQTPIAAPVPQAAQAGAAPSTATAPRTASLPSTATAGDASPESAAKNASLGAYKGQQTAFAPQVARNARRSTAAGVQASV